MGVSAAEVILEYVCPTLGVLVGNLMFSAPFRDVQRALKNHHLGDLNPTPWAFMLGNCVGWVTYSFLIQNLFVFFGNAFALVLSAWLNLQAVKLQHTYHHSQLVRKSIIQTLEEQQSAPVRLDEAEDQTNKTNSNSKECTSTDEDDCSATDNRKAMSDVARLIWNVSAQKEPAPVSHERLVVGMVAAWLAMISFVAFGHGISLNTRELVVGIMVNLNLVFFYGAPLSTILTVMRERSTASIHRPTMYTNTANGVFWGAYGVAVWDLFIVVPNGLGALIGFVQIGLTLIFPRLTAQEIPR